MRLIHARSILSFTLLLCSTAVAAADNWPQWRGPDNDGICKEKGLPTEWGENKNAVWKLAMPGWGGSTPAIWGERMFFTSEDGDESSLLCVGTDGKLIWKKTIGQGKRSFMRGEGNAASASPSTDGKHVWAFVATGEFACFDFDGNELWRFNAQERYGRFNIQHGLHTTPLLLGDRLYLVLLHLGGQWVIALDKATGQEVWKVNRPSDGRNEGLQAYASPILWHSGQESYLVVHGSDYTTAHSLKDGSEIWRLGDLNNPGGRYDASLRLVATPVATSDLIVIPTAKNGPVVGLNPLAKGAITMGSPYELWRRPKNTPDVPSPLVHDGLVYLCGERGGLICMDAKTGKEHYNQERTHSALYRASPVYIDGKIYITARDGTFLVVKAGPKFELLATNKLPDQFTASPAISNGRIYLRGWKDLYAIGESAK
jgi:outer membrane protein assembly factor BamB